ncbi:MAG: CBS domain-containing protein [Bdellovibrionales bacterium]
MQAPKIEEFMVQPVFRVTPEMKLWEVAELMMKKRISGAPVVDTADRVVSVIGEGLVLRLAATDGLEATIAHCLPKMTPAKNLIVLGRSDSFADAYKAFLKHNIHRIPIVDSAMMLVGIISRTTILQMFVESHYGKKIVRQSS